MYMPYARFANPQTQLDSTAKNTPGSIYSPPPGVYPSGSLFSATKSSGTPGNGAPGVFKYVYYNSTSNPAVVAAPAPVYYTDESFTQVSGDPTEAFITTGGACVAGYLMPNSTAYSGLTAALLNQSYVWMQIGGLLQGAYSPTTTTAAAAGNIIYGLATGSWASIVATQATFFAVTGGRLLGVQWTTIANNACDVLVGGFQSFWGS